MPTDPIIDWQHESDRKQLPPPLVWRITFTPEPNHIRHKNLNPGNITAEPIEDPYRDEVDRWAFLPKSYAEQVAGVGVPRETLAEPAKP